MMLAAGGWLCGASAWAVFPAAIAGSGAADVTFDKSKAIRARTRTMEMNCVYERAALLVGVGDYPTTGNVTPISKLRGPPNDVEIMRDMLVKKGIEAANIKITTADDLERARRQPAGGVR